MHAEMWRTRRGAVAARGRGRPRTQDAGGSIILRNAIIRYAPLAVGLKPSARQSDARLRGRFPTNLHPCLSVLSVPIRVLFRLFEAKPACASYIGSFIQRPYQCNRTSYLCTRFAAPCPQCVLWRDDGGCATWYRALPASFRPLAQPVVGIWYSTLVPHPCCHQHCWTRRGGGEI